MTKLGDIEAKSFRHLQKSRWLVFNEAHSISHFAAIYLIRYSISGCCIVCYIIRYFIVLNCFFFINGKYYSYLESKKCNGTKFCELQMSDHSWESNMRSLTFSDVFVVLTRLNWVIKNYYIKFYIKDQITVDIQLWTNKIL